MTDFNAIATETLAQFGNVHKGFYETTDKGMPVLCIYANAYGHFLSIEQKGNEPRRIVINGKVASDRAFKKLIKTWRALSENRKAA